ncbi:MAG: copper resistance protein NlpE N-terminal domain-containing protein [Thermoanaerobaculia bacterium]
MKTRHDRLVLPLALAALALAPAAGAQGNACSTLEPVLLGSSFVLVQSPEAGSRIGPGTTVSGCSRTHEGNVGWRLVGRDGRVLSEGHASGGGVDGAAPFRFTVDFELERAERGTLEVFEPRVTEEGSPPPMTAQPYVLAAGAPKLPLFGRFLGTLPCADCAGIRTELALYGDFGPQARKYVLTETWLGTPDGDRRYESRGAWQFTPGAGELSSSIVVQLEGDEAEPRYLLVEGGDLIQLDRQGGKIRSKADLRLARQP